VISALVLAAGQSRRMGRAKMSLAWGETTVLGQVVSVFRTAGIQDVLVVSGGDRAVVEQIAAGCGARVVFNPRYAEQDMLSSIQAGLRAVPPEAEAAFIALGDQPQILEETVRLLLDAYGRTSAPLIVPSYKMRRGHPWLVARPLWDSLSGMQPPQTPRDFLQAHAERILYVNVETPTVLADLDTPEDYGRSRP
jgi:molybdenum cofactor cytidylyltransferase